MARHTRAGISQGQEEQKAETAGELSGAAAHTDPSESSEGAVSSEPPLWFQCPLT